MARTDPGRMRSVDRRASGPNCSPPTPPMRPSRQPLADQSANRTLHVGFPSTTAAGLAAIGTGCRSGEHGFVGYSFRVPEAGPEFDIVNALRWRPHPRGPDLRDRVVPELIQPSPTTFERAGGGRIRGLCGLGRPARRLGIDPGAPARRTLCRGARTRRSRGRGHRSRRAAAASVTGTTPTSTWWATCTGLVGRLAHAVAPGRPAGGIGVGSPGRQSVC